ncbi:MAG: hypothetical protein Q8K17_01505, partial [Pseudohongiella sp.]|nr:hypothetical protein [Pseudohongiella sp.]
MKMTQKLAAGFILASLSLAIASTSSVAQSTQRPDLNGLWTNASLTNLQRPQGVDKLVVTPEEAALIVANTSVAGLPLAEVDAPETTVPGTAPPAGSFDFGLRGYNDFWIDPGSNLAMVKGEFRSSYLIDPPTGRVPRLE